MTATTLSLVIDPEIQTLIPPLREEERTLLEESLHAEGCRDPLVVWEGHNILLDGHNRKEICDRLRLEYAVTELALPDREAACDWVDANQLGRRNLTPDQMSVLRGRRYNRRKKAASFETGTSGNPAGRPPAGKADKEQGGKSCPPVKAGESPAGEQGGKSCHPAKTANSLAKQYGVSPRTIKNDGKYAEAVGKVAAVEPDLPERIAKGKAPPRKAVIEAATLLESHPEKAKAILAGTASRADVVRELKREETLARLTDTKALEARAVEGLYDVIVIDPPWPMKKIDRDERPNQTEFDYPTMREEELAALDIPCAESCHVWLWTTHKFLPMAMRLLAAWNLKYVCTFVWRKPGGFQPFGLPQYNCEFALYARRGAPAFIDTKSFAACFEAPRGSHSEKPEAFYETLRRVTAGRRLDMFNRRPIEGFDGWGKEAT